jgi:hypothetical protein
LRLGPRSGEHRLPGLRQRQQTPAGRAKLRERVQVEHTLPPGCVLFRTAAAIPVGVRTLNPCHVQVTVEKSALALDRRIILMF